MLLLDFGTTGQDGEVRGGVRLSGCAIAPCYAFLGKFGDWRTLEW
jgi:hypothetical protein